MVTGHLLPVIFFAAILLLLILIIRLKVNPFLALLVVSILTGFAVKMPIGEISENIGVGFGNTLKGIGIVIGLGIVLGKILSEAGATETIARLLIEKIGKKNAPLALGFTGLIVSIPVFFDAAFVILVSLAKNIAKISRIPIITLTTSLAIGLIVSHNMIIPTPGPVDVGTSLEVGFGGFASLAILIAVPAVLIGGWLYSLWLGKKDKALVEEEVTAATTEKKRPGAFVSFTSLLLPILIILLGSAISFALPDGSVVKELFEFIGNKNTALLISVFAAMFMLRRYLVKSMNQLIVEAAESSGMILLITGVGGAFGYIVYLSGIGEYIVTTLTSLNISVITTGFLLAAVLRAALGSSTVALVTASTILAPVALLTDVPPLLTAISITLGGLCLSLPNDSGFWVVSRFSGLTITQTLKSWTLGSTIAGVTGFIIVLIINSFI